MTEILLNEDRLAIRQLPDSLMPTLAGRYYSDPAIFALEQERIFATQWACVWRADEIAEPGAFVTVQVAYESVIVLRGRDGNLRAFLNICRHRGARLCTEETGAVKRAIQCMYHAWTYGLDGKLVAAPNLTNMPDIDRVEYGLIPVALREWLGYVWVNLADAPPDFDEVVVAQATERLGDAERINRYTIDELALGRRIEYDVRANWKHIVENFQECYHCATIHPELTEVIPEFVKGWAAQSRVGQGAELGDEIRGFTVDGRDGFGRLPGLTDEEDRRYYALTVKPQALFNFVPDHVIVLRLWPVAVDRTLVTCDWLYGPEVLASGVDISASVELMDRVNRQDFAAGERCQLASGSRGYARGGVLVPNEHHLTKFHGWVHEMLEARTA